MVVELLWKRPTGERGRGCSPPRCETSPAKRSNLGRAPRVGENRQAVLRLQQAAVFPPAARRVFRTASLLPRSLAARPILLSACWTPGSGAHPGCSSACLGLMRMAWSQREKERVLNDHTRTLLFPHAFSPGVALDVNAAGFSGSCVGVSACKCSRRVLTDARRLSTRRLPGVYDMLLVPLHAGPSLVAAARHIAAPRFAAPQFASPPHLEYRRTLPPFATAVTSPASSVVVASEATSAEAAATGKSALVLGWFFATERELAYVTKMYKKNGYDEVVIKPSPVGIMTKPRGCVYLGLRAFESHHANHRSALQFLASASAAWRYSLTRNGNACAPLCRRVPYHSPPPAAQAAGQAAGPGSAHTPRRPRSPLRRRALHVG